MDKTEALELVRELEDMAARLDAELPREDVCQTVC